MANLIKFKGPAPELIKIALATGTEATFFGAAPTYTPIYFDSELLKYTYGDQIFTDVSNQKNMVWLSEAVTGDCLDKMNEFVNNPLVDGLIAYYPFNGNANDESGNGNDGIVNGATLTTDRFGNANSAYEFDGVDDYIEASELGLNGVNEFSYSFWANINGASTGSFTVVLGEGVNNSFSVLSANSDVNLLRFKLLTTSANIELEYRTNLNTYVSYVFSFKNGYGYLYVNGVFVDSDFWDGTVMSDGSPFQMGSIGNRTYYLNGQLDDIRIYNRALSETEVEKLYNLEKV